MFLGAVCVVLPFARGGVDLWTEIFAVVGCAAAAALATRGGARRLPAYALALAIVPLVIALQLVPLPPALVGVLSPSAAALFVSHLQPVGLFPAWRPVSLDVPATARELGKSVACLLALVATTQLARSQRTKRHLLGAVALSGTGVALVALAAALAGIAPLLQSRVTFVNPNHLAGFLDLTAFLSLGFALRHHGSRRLLWLLAFAVTGSGVFLSLSRSGIAAFLVGGTTFAVLHGLRPRSDDRDRRARPRVVVSIALSAAIAIASYLALDPVLAEMRTARGAAEEAKVQMWRTAGAIVRDYPLVGVGRGAFAAVFPEYKLESYPLTFTHLENEWLQAPVDLGLPAGLLLVSALAWAWLGAARSRDLSRLELGALAGLAAAAAHDVFDFSLETLGVAIPFTVMLGLVARPRLAVRVPGWLLPGVACAGLLVAAGGAWTYRVHSCEREPAAPGSARTSAEAVALARAALRWHPADDLPVATAGARLAAEGRCREAVEWLQRAMQRNPTAPAPHRVAARCLSADTQHAAAKAEYRLAYLMGDAEALDEALRRFSTLEDALSVTPDLPQALLRAGTRLSGRPADAAVLFDRAWTGFGNLEALRALSAAQLAKGDAEVALASGRRLEAESLAAPDGYLAAAAALARLGRPEEAHRELELGASRVIGSRALLVPLVNQALGARRYSEARRLAEQISALTDVEIAAKRVLIAQVLQASGRTSEALASAYSARDATPSDPRILALVAELCASMRRYDEAIEALETASAVPGVAPDAYRARLASLRQDRAAQLEVQRRDAALQPARSEAPLVR